MINNYLHKSQTIINNHKIIKNSKRWYLFGRTSGGFCQVLDPFCTLSPAHCRVIRDTFIFQPFSYLLTSSATVSLIHLKSVLMLVNIAKVLLVVKTLIRSAATLFSSHENIKQQPN